MSEDLSKAGRWNKAAATVSPESIKPADTDFNAFSPEEELFLEDFMPNSVANMLKDKSNWSNRLSAVGDIEKTLKTSKGLSDADLKSVVDLILIAVNDSQSKVAHKGTQVLEYLVTLVGKGIAPHLTSLTPKVLVKISSNKGNLKKAGMSLFKTLMGVLGPMKVLDEVVSCGLHHKASRVREEAVNVIISALIYYESAGLQHDIYPIASELVTCMADCKAKVRQAVLEALSLIASQMNDVEFSELMSVVLKIDASGQSNGVSLRDVYLSRLARKLVPTLDEHGLVRYAIPILKASSLEGLYTGPDVDWITAPVGGGTPSLQTQVVSSSPPQLTPISAASGSAGQQPSTFRPYRSAGKRPWETDSKQEVGISSAPPQLSSDNPPSVVSSVAPHPVITVSNTTTTNTSSRRLTGNSYVELHLSKLRHPPSTGISTIPSVGGVAGSSSQPVLGSGLTTGTKPHPQIHHKNSLGSLMSSNASKIEKQGRRSSLDGGQNVSLMARYNSYPDGTDTSALAVVVSGPSDEKVTENAMDTHGNSMSLTWPRANLVLTSGASTGLTSVPPLKAPAQINADPLGMAGVQNAVKTSFSRPPSKPRVRNPLTLLKSQTTPGHGISPPLSGSSGCPIPSIGSSRGSTDSPTQLERDFLSSGGGNLDQAGPPTWGEASFDDEYYMIPEDTIHLDSSLTSSLSSLCAGKEGEGNIPTPDVDKLKHIRREAASRKAQIISASTTASNSPESSRQPSGSDRSRQPSVISDRTITPGSPNFSPPNRTLDLISKMPPPPPSSSSSIQQQQPPGADIKATPIVKKWNMYSGIREEKTYSQAFAKKLLSTPNKLPQKAVATQGKREKEKPLQLAQSEVVEEVDTSIISFSISLEGHGLERGEGGAAPPNKDTQLPKKKVKRLGGVHPVHGKNRTTISSSMFGNQEGGSGRPTIERGGTNMISMEVSGVGSRGVTTAENKSSVLSQTTKESFIRKKQQHYQDDDDSSTNTVQSSPGSLLKKPPAVNRDCSADTSASSGNSFSAPPEGVHKRSRPKRSNEGSRGARSDSGSGLSSRDTPRKHTGGKTTLTVTDIDSSFSSGGGNSPQETDSALLESQVHSNPDQAIRVAQQSIASEDWSNKCQGMIMIMCVARNYPHLLQPQLRVVLLAVLKEVKNLRSSVAKKAVECLTCLFSTMKRAVEPDLDQTVQILLHKCCESNAFLREVVEKSMSVMTKCVSPPKALTALIAGGFSHRNSQVRKMTSKFICGVMENYDPAKFLHSSKDLLEKVLPVIIQLTKDSSPDARYYARRSLNVLWPEPDFLQVASRVLKNNLFADAKEAVETIKMKGVGDPNGSSSTSGSRHPTGSLRVSMQSSPHKDVGGHAYELTPHQDGSQQSSSGSEPPSRRSRKQQHHHHHSSSEPARTVGGGGDLPLPEGLVERMQASSWSERFEAITELEKYVATAAPQNMTTQLQKVFDAFCLRLTDRNSKVNLHALQAFSSMVPVMHTALVPIINNIMGTLVPNLASRNLTIHSTAMTVLDLMAQHMDAVHLLPTVANSSQFGNSRVQPIMTRILASLTSSVYTQKPQQVHRLVLPVIWHHVSSRTPVTGETRATLQELCRVLVHCMGEGFLESAAHLSVESRKKLEDLLEHKQNR